MSGPAAEGRGTASSARTRWAPGAEVLAAAATAVARVTAEGESADAALASFDQQPNRAAVHAVTLGTLRWYLRLLPAIEALLQPKRRRMSARVQALLVVAAHQVEYSRNAPQATVHIAVDAARALGQDRASPLVNAVMRRFVAERAELLSRLDGDISTRTAHPRWLVEELQEAWSDHIVGILAGNNVHPPLVLRADLSRVDRADYLAELVSHGLPARAVSFTAAAILLERAVAVREIPGFDGGRVSVQDAGAQLAATLLGARPGMRVLDACAAPGGKTLHLLEHTPELAELIAMDIAPERLARVRENLERGRPGARWAEVPVQLVAADVRGAARGVLQDGSFDRILVDAPCSSTGVIRRHPDIKLLRRREDVPAFAKAQLEILRGAYAMLAPGGRMLYCTCSVLPAENEEIVRRFLELEPSVRLVATPPAPELAPGALDREIGVQLLPGAEAGTDGFYYACIEKTTAGN